jgi:fructose-bisphosphate aldolase, class II
MLRNTLKLLKKAKKEKYAVGHFNINNMEICQAIIAAAEKKKSPVIIATSEGAIKYAGLNYLINIAKAAAQAKVPVALHLDHGRDLNMIKQCIKVGYSSVMIDASHLNFEENVKLTKKVVQMAHKKGLTVEAELGTIGGVEDNVKSKNIEFVNPKKVNEFVKKTGCDFLAIGIGTSHGAHKFKGKVNLRYDLLKNVSAKVKVPLVLHGASGLPKNIVNLAKKYGAKLGNAVGVPDKDIKKAIKHGICKINIDTDLRIAFDAGIRKYLKNNPKDFDPRHIMNEARKLMQVIVEKKIEMFGSSNKA